MRILVMLLALAALSAFGQKAKSVSVVLGVSYVGVSVSDLDRSTAFYAPAANLTEVSRGRWAGIDALDGLAGRNGVSADFRMLRSSNAQLRFMAFENRPPEALEASIVPVHGPGIAHVCFQAAETTETYQKFRANGAQLIGVDGLVHLNPRSPVYYSYLRDVDDIMFEVEHVDVPALGLPEPPEHDYRIRHVSIATADIDRLVSFYSFLLNDDDPRRIGHWFGLSGERLDQIAGLSDVKIAMAWFQVSNLELEIIQYKSHPTELPVEPRPLEADGYNMIVFEVTNVEAASAQLIAAGGTIVSEAEAMDGGTIVFGRDPDGNLLGLQSTGPDTAASTSSVGAESRSDRS